ncbi:non-ribosomal peptide synthetase [Paenibacillus lentus]|uniref:Amino acid adenylation domain-containing protein n=1 Tax=Paenibacillus lentus TaxID=1338368 RepID=A0A3S8S000_9BACL|nr:non-ribosomal peptide synthetase [Paenibacillus lentus]AZK48523.1 amino acid adenylation domain-containing protein [Paenibacillus lentus]
MTAGSDYHMDRLAIAASQKSKERDFWLTTLSDEFEKEGFLSDYPHATGVTVEKVALSFPMELAERLVKVSGNSDSKLHVVLAAGLAALLSRMTNRSEVVLGTSIYRQREEADFINTVLPLRATMEAGITFRQCLLNMQEMIVSAVEHQSYPMELIARQLGLPLDDHQAHPLFEVALLLTNIQDECFLKNTRCKTLFTLLRTDTNGIEGELQYNAELYQRETMNKIISRYIRLLQEALANPDMPLTQFDILLPGEREQLLQSFVGNTADYLCEQTVHQLFEEQVKRSPEALAVVSSAGSITYRELNEKANQVARVLCKEGVEAGDIVGLLLTPSTEMLVGMLGVMKAGGAFLPLDPDYPNDRIQYILTDSHVKVVLTQQQLADKLGSRPGLFLDDPQGFNETVDNLGDPNSSATDLAYVIYTSGSTGQPKGVMIEHRSLTNLSYWHNRAFEVTAADRSIKYAGFGFDASVWEVFPYLLAGASLYIVPPEIRLDAKKLGLYLAEQEITIAFLPTMMCEQFMELVQSEDIALRILLTGGERLKRVNPGSYRLFNNYGPTENTVVTTFVEVTGADGVIPIGRPIDNVQVYILDQQLQLLPPGVPGEICVAGAGLARGYLGRPELTEDKFVQHPFLPNERLYRTGDLGRWLPNGMLEYWGRQDDQVKVRGYRIEPGEIEMHLRQYEGVHEAIVLVREDEAGQNMLCAYYTGMPSVSASELRTCLLAKLPSYMIPAYFVYLEQFPVTANGKLDTRSLPDPRKHVHTGKEYVAPRGEIEGALVRIWSEILGMDEDRVSVHDTFFDLGGNSFQLVQVVNKLSETFGHDIPVPVLFQYTTIAALGGYLQRLNHGDEQQPVDIANHEQLDEGFEMMEQTMLILEGNTDA